MTIPAALPAKPPLLEMRGIRKTFPGVTALAGVDLSVQAGEIHALVGENGAGKSTLMKVLSGVHPHGSHEGEILVDGQLQRFAGIRDSEAQGIIIIHQELALVPLLSITENIFLGHELARRGVVDAQRSHTLARELLQRVGLRVAPSLPVAELGVGQQQLVEIAKALAKRVRLLILDEPTASLNETDSQALLALLRSLKAQGIASILISHKLSEVTRVADRITVLRDGATIETLPAGASPVSEDRIIRAMVGRELSQRYPPRPERRAAPGPEILSLHGWRVGHPQHPGRDAIDGVNLRVHRGEILGIAGLMGSGRTELALSVFGRSWGRDVRGEARVHGQRADLSSVRKAIAHGMAYVTEDRKGCGLVLAQSIRHNISLAGLPRLARRGVVDEAAEARVARHYRDTLRLRCAGIEQPVLHLSGGNQQKVVLAKWLLTEPQLLILDEPTRGIDVGAKYEIYLLIRQLADSGRGIVLISSEMPELLGLCDRLMVMNEGRFVAEFDHTEASQERILRAIVGSGQALCA